MKICLHCAFAVGALALLAVISISAGSGSEWLVNVPFDFSVTDKQLHSGTYAIISDNARRVSIRAEETKSLIFTTARSTAPIWRTDGFSRLVFHRYGKRFFLRQISDAASGQAFDVTMSKVEQQVAASSGQPETLALLPTAQFPK